MAIRFIAEAAITRGRIPSRKNWIGLYHDTQFNDILDGILKTTVIASTRPAEFIVIMSERQQQVKS